MDLKDISTARLIARWEELDMLINPSTHTYAAATIADYLALDPTDPWDDINAIDAELGKREE